MPSLTISFRAVGDVAPFKGKRFNKKNNPNLPSWNLKLVGRSCCKAEEVSRMGVPQFFKWLIGKYPRIITVAIEHPEGGYDAPNPNGECDAFYLGKLNF